VAPMSPFMLIYSDGGARGNPGPAAVAFIALNEQSETIKTDTSFIGVRTNNQAEYVALILALTFASGQKAKEVVCHLDSELVVKQLNGEYTVKNPELQQLWRKIQVLKKGFERITFICVPREHPQIQRADSLLNQTLDAQKSSSLTNKKLIDGSVFVHASIRTSNMERSIAFYSQLLGLKLLSRQEIKKTNAEIAFLQDVKGKGCILELTFYQNQTKFSQPKYEERLFDHLGFEVEDIQKTIAMMRKEHLTITDEPFALNEHTTIAFLEDPDGTLIELIERK
jgi:lactoylglutathione lyase